MYSLLTIFASEVLSKFSYIIHISHPCSFSLQPKLKLECWHTQPCGQKEKLPANLHECLRNKWARKLANPPPGLAGRPLSCWCREEPSSEPGLSLSWNSPLTSGASQCHGIRLVRGVPPFWRLKEGVRESFPSLQGPKNKVHLSSDVKK